MNKKIDRLKRNIIDEKELFQKLITNYDSKFNDYFYYYNLIYLGKYINNFNNEYLDNFSKCYTFKERSKHLFEYFISQKNVKGVKQDIISKEITPLTNADIISRINDNYLFKYSKLDKVIKIMCYEKTSGKIIDINRTNIYF